MSKLLLIPLAAFALLATAAHGQSAGDANGHSGRDAVGLCYSSCLNKALSDWEALGTWSSSTWEATWKLYLDHKSAFSEISNEDFDRYVIGPLQSMQRAEFCSAVRDSMRNMEGCRAGCYDVEKAKGTNTSSARNHFMAYYRRYKDFVTESGLWIDHNTPVDIESACDSYFEVDNSDTDGTKPKSIMPPTQGLPR